MAKMAHPRHPDGDGTPKSEKTSNDRLNQARAADQERGVQEQVLFFGG